MNTEEMKQTKQERKIVMLSILGICFAFLGWSDVVSDFTYKKFSQLENIVLIISIIGFIHSVLSVVANLIVIKISHRNPQKLFNKLLLLCSALAIIVGISTFSNNIYVFSICYIIYVTFFETLSMYHFAFETSATEKNRYIQVENKRKTIFKIISGRFKMFENDIYQENNVEKNAIMDIGIFTAQGLSSLVLLNIPFKISIAVVLISLIIAIILKIQCQRYMNKVVKSNSSLEMN